MTAAVIDASALVLALIGRERRAVALRRDIPGTHLHAPHLVDAECANVLRRHERGGQITPLEAAIGLEVGAVLVRHRYPHTGPVAARAWELRDNLSFYDALYVALAELLDVPLWTADARIARAPNVSCEVRVV